MVLDGPGEDGFAALMAQHRFQQKCCRRFAVGSGDAAELELGFGMSEEICGNRGERRAALRHFDHR